MRRVLVGIFSASLISCVHVEKEEAVVNPLPPAGVVDAWAGHRPWEKPDFNGQQNALGYSAEAFSVPPALRARVDFWKKVYAEIDSMEGFIHDVEAPFTIYQVQSLRDIYENAELTAGQKEKLIDQRLDEVKKRVAAEHGLPEERIRFQRGIKDRFQRAIYVSGRYIQDFERIFAEQGLPKELTRLVFVESSFNIMARSKVGASGLWQIMPSLARSHRMISSEIDQRNDPFAATMMAARILKDNYEMLGSWPLAITAYNHGPTGVKKMVASYQTTDLAELINVVQNRRSFAFASKNFYACFMAALEIEREANKYFKPAVWAPPLNPTKLQVGKNLKKEKIVEEYFKGNEDQFLQHNPHLIASRNHRNTVIPMYLYIPNVAQEDIAGISKSTDAIQESTIPINLRWPAAKFFN